MGKCGGLDCDFMVDVQEDQYVVSELDEEVVSDDNDGDQEEGLVEEACHPGVIAGAVFLCAVRPCHFNNGNHKAKAEHVID